VVAGISKVFVGEIVEKGQIHACVTVQSSVFFIWARLPYISSLSSDFFSHLSNMSMKSP
jgi:hypothetical protein